MLENLLETYLPIIINIFEIMGVIIICIGSSKAFYKYILSLIKKEKYPIRYEFANSMAMGLEFKLAAEILKTVLAKSIEELFFLGGITLLRGLLTLIIHFEMKWEKEREAEEENKKGT
ncbi:MAG: DUF1622 domain-containing protein [Clostridium sp.]